MTRSGSNKRSHGSSSTGAFTKNTGDFVETNSACVSRNVSRSSTSNVRVFNQNDLQRFMGNKSGGDNASSVSKGTESDDETPSSVPSSKPRDIIIPTVALGIQKGAPSSHAIAEFVANKVFAQVKFIVSVDRQLAYNMEASLCKYVVDGMHMANDPFVRDWWESAKKIVRNKISQLRNDRAMSLKWEFFGKHAGLLSLPHSWSI